MPPSRKPRSPLFVVLVVLAVSIPVVGILIALLLPARCSAREGARRAQCMHNMKNIALALLVFESEKGRFPAMVDPAKTNQPPCSWRIQILPGLDQKDIFERYNVNEPWNGPKNCKLADPMPRLYRCPSNDSPAVLNTDYLTVVGPKAMFREVGSIKTGDITDGQSNTIMVVESHQSGIHWMEPRDMKADDATLGVNSESTASIGSAHPGIAIVAFADGHVRHVSDDIDPEVLKAMTTHQRRGEGRSGHAGPVSMSAGRFHHPGGMAAISSVVA